MYNFERIEERRAVEHEYKSLNSHYGLNCVRAYRCPALKCDDKRGYDRKLFETSPINRVFRFYMSKSRSELCNDNKIPIRIIQYNKETKHSLKTHQINFIIDKIAGESKLFVKVFYIFELKTYILWISNYY